jgi:hypothetical protein
MKIIVCGGRHYLNLNKVREVLSEYQCEKLNITLIHGGATGADTLADTVAKELGWDVKVYPAEWSKRGRAAGPVRNRQMAEDGADLCIAFPGHRGTADMVFCAQAVGIKVVRVPLEEGDR